MPILIPIEKPRRWIQRDWKSLPSLRLPRHDSDGTGGWEFHPLVLRCEHGVYLTRVPDSMDFGPNAELQVWIAPYCEVCQAEFTVYESFREQQKHYRLIRPRPLDPGEYWNRDGKLFDRQPTRPETFTRAIKLRGRTMTADLRLQEDYETGRPRLETAGGYVAAAFGYSKAGKGHGPAMDADNIRLSWMAQSEGSAVTYERGNVSYGPNVPLWVASLPAVDGGITHENWLPMSLPVGESKREQGVHYGFLNEHDTFADDRTIGNKKWFRASEPRVFKWEVDLVHEHRRSLLAAHLRFIRFYRYSPFKKVEQRNTEAAADILRWHVLARLARREDRWWLRGVKEPLPSKKQLARWKRKLENQRSGSVNRVPLRRTKRWSDDWRTDRKMRDLEARLNMYHYREDATEPRRVNVARMVSTANRRYWSEFILRYLDGARDSRSRG